MKLLWVKYLSLILIVAQASVLFSCTMNPKSNGSANYTKKIIKIAMRDGVTLNTEIYTPNSSDGNLPILLTRTPYGLRYDKSGIHSSLSTYYKELAADKYIFVFQDIRGRYSSGGKFRMLRTPIKKDIEAEVDEATDTYDTVEWLLNNLNNHNNKVGILGISYGGWLTAIALTDLHPAVKAISPQASPSDMFIGDDFYHNGAFRLAPSFGYAALMERSKENYPFDFGNEDVYDFYLNLGPLSNANKKYFFGDLPTWNDFMNHSNYDEFWKEKEVTQYLENIDVAALNVAGWWDAEDFYGPMKIYEKLEKNDQSGINSLVVGPWRHGGWARGKGDSLGAIGFGSNSSIYYRKNIQAPWFAHYLKGRNITTHPEAHVFVTGLNQWKSYNAWPPINETKSTKFYFISNGTISNTPTNSNAGEKFRTYISDPNNPVPYTKRPIKGFWQGAQALWKVEDQNFISNRDDVLTWQSEPLNEEIEIAGEVIINLFVSSTGTDADFVAKLINVYPKDLSNPAMDNYQLMIADEVMRSKFRNDFSNPSPLVADEITPIKISLGTRAHRFNKGHRIMVKIHSTWFPLIDRNPQKFIEIPKAKEEDYQKAKHTIYLSGPNSTFLELPILKK